MRRVLFALLLACGAMAVQADDTGEALAVVNVSSVRDPELKSYRQMLKGLDAFEAFSALAPKADLRFMLLMPPSGLPATELSLRIADDQQSVGVPIARDRTFALPRLPAFENTDAEMLLNVKKGGARWRPLVRTPGLAPDTRRLGDLRLECEVRWAAELHVLSIARRNLYRALGGPCHTLHVRVYFMSPRPLASATLVEAERRVRLPLESGGLTYIAPLHDASFSNDALVQLVYKDAAQ